MSGLITLCCSIPWYYRSLSSLEIFTNTEKFWCILFQLNILRWLSAGSRESSRRSCPRSQQRKEMIRSKWQRHLAHEMVGNSCAPRGNQVPLRRLTRDLDPKGGNIPGPTDCVRESSRWFMKRSATLRKTTSNSPQGYDTCPWWEAERGDLSRTWAWLRTPRHQVYSKWKQVFTTVKSWASFFLVCQEFNVSVSVVFSCSVPFC